MSNAMPGSSGTRTGGAPSAPGLAAALSFAARAVDEAEALVVTAGAGMGVDSGLPDFRGPEGFWRAYPAFRELGLRFEELRAYCRVVAGIVGDMLTELFLPTKGGTAVSFDDDFRRLGGKEIHVITADVPGAADFDRTQPNTIHRVALKRVPWLKPESLLIYLKLLARAVFLVATRRFVAIFAGRVLPEGFVAWIVARLSRHPVLVYAHGEELTNWGRGRKFALMRFVFRHADAVLANSDFTRWRSAGSLIQVISIEEKNSSSTILVTVS